MAQPPNLQRMLQQAQEGMGRAEQRLGQGEPRGAQAGEQQAIEQLQKFEDAMQQLAKQSGVVESTSEALRLIAQRGLKLDGEVVVDNRVVAAGTTVVVQAGKRRFARVTVV